ncbi:HutD/Ves family protein [Microvirga sp. 2TAF3]|uniref:HutD/Ves family protein n=1 Tax=Microvirga sp. 2TAF3 TaxID=3233014 RepID=UPI003F9E7838
MRVIPARAYRRMPWKNGGGETVEIAVSPEGSSLDEFDWRVSMARVEEPGPFSTFPQVDRTLAILDGVEIVLRFSRQETVHLTPASAPYSFAADVPVDAALTDGGITDLNVMSRRGRVRHRLRRIAISGSVTLSREGDEIVLLVLRSDVRVKVGDTETRVASGDTAVLASSSTGAIEIAPVLSAATVFVIDFWRQ